MHRILMFGLLGSLTACSGNSTSDGSQTGGASASGGQAGAAPVGSGGAAHGGAANGGAATGQGGLFGSGGNRGGSTAAGGVSGVGGAATGGNASGGSSALGGASAMGGSSGGRTSSGGTPSSGGTMSSGGTPSNGGTTTAGAANGGSGATSGSLVPAHGALFGAFVGTGTVAELESTLTRKLAIIHNFFGWSDDWTTELQTDLSGGRIPLITWEAWDGGVGTSLDTIISGAHDTMIRSRAAAAKNAGQKFFLRWGHEMNGNWYPWDGSHNGANAAAVTKYISAYRHIHDLFSSAGANNVQWIFCPNADSVPGDSWNQAINYYPGDDYVDWVGFDGYNWGSTQTWQAFSAIAGRIYPSLASKNKPMIIPETASTEMGGDKAAWISAVVPALSSSYPNIKALVWFNVNKETDWRMDSSSAARTASVAMATNAYFNP